MIALLWAFHPAKKMKTYYVLIKIKQKRHKITCNVILFQLSNSKYQIPTSKLRIIENLIWSWNTPRTADVSPSSSPLRDGLRGGMSATQWQKFHTDDVNQCLHNKSGSDGVPNANLFNSSFLLVDFGKVLCSSANELQKNSNASSGEDYILQILTVC